MVKASQVKAYLKDKGVRTSAELLAALESKLTEMLVAAAATATAAGRKTVKPEDLG